MQSPEKSAFDPEKNDYDEDIYQRAKKLVEASGLSNTMALLQIFDELKIPLDNPLYSLTLNRLVMGRDRAKKFETDLEPQEQWPKGVRTLEENPEAQKYREENPHFYE